MASEIVSGATSDKWTVDATSKAGRVTLYDSTGALISTSNPLPISIKTGRVFVGNYACSTFRTLGTAATPQNIASIENPSASGKSLALKRLTIQVDSTAVLTSVSPSIKVSIPVSLPTGGTAIPAVKFLSTYVSAVAIVRGGTASDGGGATAITATAGNTIWTQLVDRLHTAVGFVGHPDATVLPQLIEEEPFILLAGEALLIQGVTANAATTHFVVNAMWEEFT